MSRTVSVEVRYIDIDVDLADIGDDDLKAELAERNLISGDAVPPLNSEEAHPLHEIYYALKFGLSDRAMALMRSYCCDQLGVIL